MKNRKIGNDIKTEIAEAREEIRKGKTHTLAQIKKELEDRREIYR